MSGVVPPAKTGPYLLEPPGHGPSTQGAGEGRSPPLPSLSGLEISLKTAGIDDLEAVALYLTPERFDAFVAGSPEVGEAVMLRTCQRVEVYLWVRGEEGASPLGRELLPSGLTWERREGAGAVRHLFRVAAGLESMALGEGEVRRQVRSAAGRVITRTPRPVLRPLLLSAVGAVQSAAPDVPVQRSIAALAAARVREEPVEPGARVVLLGSGSVGRQVAELLATHRPLTILYHVRPPPSDFLERVRARCLPLSALAEELATADVLVAALKSGSRLVGVTELAGRERPLLAIDLGVPRNIDPLVASLPRVRLLDLSSLRAAPGGQGTLDFEAEIDRRAAEAAATLRSFALEAWVDRFRRHAEQFRQEAVKRSRAHLGPLTPAQEDAIEDLTRRLVARLLAGPTEGFRSIPEGSEGDRLRRWALRWLDPTPTDP